MSIHVACFLDEGQSAKILPVQLQDDQIKSSLFIQALQVKLKYVHEGDVAQTTAMLHVSAHLGRLVCVI
jgi:hypothetical protein